MAWRDTLAQVAQTGTDSEDFFVCDINGLSVARERVGAGACHGAFSCEVSRSLFAAARRVDVKRAFVRAACCARAERHRPAPPGQSVSKTVDEPDHRRGQPRVAGSGPRGSAPAVQGGVPDCGR